MDTTAKKADKTSKSFFDLLVNRQLPVDHEQIKAVHERCVETRNAIGPVVSLFRDKAKAYREAQAKLFDETDIDALRKFRDTLRGHKDPQPAIVGETFDDIKRDAFRALRENVFKQAHATLGIDLEHPDAFHSGWVEKINNDPHDKVSIEVIGTYFQLFTDMGFYNAAIRLYEAVPAASELKIDSDVLVGLANAYNYRADEIPAGPGDKNSEPKYVPNPDPHKAMAIAGKLEREFSGVEFEYATHYLKPKIAGIKARAEILIAEENAEKVPGPDKAAIRRVGLENAHKLYRDNFTHDTGYHHYTGYNAMLTSALLGNLTEARDLAPKVFLSTMRDNGLFSDDTLTVFRTMMTMIVNPGVLNLPAGTKANNTIDTGLSSLQSKIVEPAQKHAFIRDAEKLLEALKAEQAKGLPASMQPAPDIDALETKILPALKSLGRAKTGSGPDYVGKSDHRRELLERYAYSTAANSIIPGAGSGKGVVLGGNLSKGGLIPDVNISSQLDYFAILPLVSVPLKQLEKDLHCEGKIFPDDIRDKSLKELALENQIGGDHKTGKFYDAIRILVREIFHTQKYNMENMGSEGHKTFENGLRHLYSIAGLSHDDLSKLEPRKTPADGKIYSDSPTATNAAHLMAMRLGDCRMYKVMSGLFHRIAKAAAQNDVIHKMETGSLSTKEALNTARDIRRVQLVNFDLDLYSNVEVGAGGWADRNKEGYFVKNKTGEMGYIEPHSVNLLVERTATGEIDNMFLACTFYNGEYRDETTKEIKAGATYNLRVPITKEMIRKIDKGPDQKPEFEIDLSKNKALGVDTGFKIWDPEKNQAVEPAKLVVKASKYSHSNELSYGNTRRLYSGNPSVFMSAQMPPFIDLAAAWKSKMDDRAILVGNEVDNIVKGHPPTALPATAKGFPVADAVRAVV